jgi:phosphoribosylamine-glycine ligase
LREEHRPRVFENRVLRIFGPKKDKVRGEWRKLHSKEFNDLYRSPTTVRVMKCGEFLD